MLRACVWLPIQLFKSQLFIQPFSSVHLRVGGWLVVGQAIGRTLHLGSSIISWVEMEPNGTEWTLFPERSNVFQ